MLLARGGVASESHVADVDRPPNLRLVEVLSLSLLLLLVVVVVVVIKVVVAAAVAVVVVVVVFACRPDVSKGTPCGPNSAKNNLTATFT